MGKGSSPAVRPTIGLVPGDYFSPKQPDEHFLQEAQAARALGMKRAVIPDGDRQSFIVGEAGDVAVYRGWMLTPDDYTRLYQTASERGASLLTHPDQYRRAHELPGWCHAFEGLTPHSTWTNSLDETSIQQVLNDMPEGSCIVKDYVKSLKHYWDEACYIPDVRDTRHAHQVINRFIELREDVVGGIVLRQFEQFTGPEVRTWWRDGQCVLVTPHPDTDPQLPADIDRLPLDDISQRLKACDLDFVTVDCVHVGHDWRVVEVGDGGVSDRPRSIDAGVFMQAITCRD